MIEKLEAKMNELKHEKSEVVNHDYSVDIEKALREYERQLMDKCAQDKNSKLAIIDAKLEVIAELIDEEEE